MSEPPVPLRRVRPWGEHPLAIPLNLSWFFSALALLLLIPIPDAPRSVWIGWGVWLVANALFTALVWNRRSVLLEKPRGTAEGEIVRGTSLLRDSLRRLRRNQLATLSIGVLLVLILVCFSQRVLHARWSAASTPDNTSFVARHFHPFKINKEETFAAPTWKHWFGTDALGRDLFARTLYGGTISFLVALVATCVSLAIGVTWGAVAGYFGGRIDHYMMRLVDILYGLPFMFLVILILTLVNGLHATASKHRDDVRAVAELERDGMFSEAKKLAEERKLTRSMRTAVFLADNVKPIYAMFFALGLVSWLTMARITRGQVLSLKEREFVAAARVIGAGNLRILARHIIPNLLGPVIVYTTLTIPGVMLSEAFLSFLGLGISEPECSWGSLASEGLAGINVVKPYWWLIVYPGAAISLALFSLNFIGDGLRDALDPKGRR